VLKVKEMTTRTVGIIVDAVSDSQNVSKEQIKDTPDFGDVVTTEFITGVAAIDDTMVMLLDIDKLLHSQQIG
jgi:purine-binding chemotaxis protein CheW